MGQHEVEWLVLKLVKKAAKTTLKKTSPRKSGSLETKNKEMTDGSRLLYRIVLKWNKKKRDTFILQLKTAN